MGVSFDTMMEGIFRLFDPENADRMRKIFRMKMKGTVRGKKFMKKKTTLMMAFGIFWYSNA